MSVKEGDVLAGKYRVERVLGEGGMGVVVAAMHLQLEQRVALKFLLPGATQHPDQLARFSREARAAAKMRSDHVARVIDVGSLETGAPFIVMEYLDGGDLSSYLKERGPLAVAHAAELTLEACEGLAEAHALGIVHRDLKPANLFLANSPDGTVCLKILDFGISKVSSPEPGKLDMTRTGAVMGSPYYMSPEQMRSSRAVDGRADIWSLGVILYEAVSGSVPFDAPTMAELCAMILTEPPRPLGQSRGGIPPRFDALVLRCLQKDTSSRFQSVAELAVALAEFAPQRAARSVERILKLSGRAAPAGHRPEGEGPRPLERSIGANWGRTWSRGIRARNVWGAVAAFVFLVGVGSWVLLHKRLVSPHFPDLGSAGDAPHPSGAASVPASVDRLPPPAQPSAAIIPTAADSAPVAHTPSAAPPSSLGRAPPVPTRAPPAPRRPPAVPGSSPSVPAVPGPLDGRF